MLLHFLVTCRLALRPASVMNAAAAAAQVAAHEADALLDSIQMPALKVPANISLEGTKESHSVTCSESSDESTTDVPLGPLAGVVARRSARQKL